MLCVWDGLLPNVNPVGADEDGAVVDAVVDPKPKLVDVEPNAGVLVAAGLKEEDPKFNAGLSKVD